LTEGARDSPHDVITFVARTANGRLLARLATRWRDVQAAEDALAGAFSRALDTWPRDGVPASPEAWLLTTARHLLVDEDRRARVRSRDDVLAALAVEEASQDDPDAIRDDRLRLMLVCAHPAIDAAIRPALILQTVLGLEVKTMASAFLLAPDTLNKRLVRAKAKIRAAALRFEEPEAADMPQRLHAVLEAIYAAYFLGREGTETENDRHDELGREAIYLAEVVAAAPRPAAEALGLRALFALCEARRGAQVNAAGEFVPLLDQDPRLWDATQLATGYALLQRAAQRNEPGPFQLEAAIHGAHGSRARSGAVPWPEIAALYARLVEAYPTTGAEVGMAVAVTHAEGAARGLRLLEAIPNERVTNYQPYWVALAHLHDAAGAPEQAARCRERALGLTTHPRVRRFLESQRNKRHRPDA